MKAPGWVRTVGILGIILGGMGESGSIQQLFLPRLMAEQAAAMSDLPAAPYAPPLLANLQAFMSRLIHAMTDEAPPWFRTWTLAAALTGMVVFGAYIVVCAGLLRMRPGSVRRFYWVTGVVLAYKAAGFWVTAVALPMLRFTLVPGLLLGFAGEIGLLIAVVVKAPTGWPTQPPP
ncbi:MAG TPA: hypothetical protein VNL37_06760, partial [Candidatus Polarisedimenticolia bacterium]|nr:hypothetical protein [Candidatus Polarisedimenticolia bacterium]